MEWLHLWLNHIGAGEQVTCYLSPIKALPLVKGRVSRPRITIGSRTIVFPVEIESGSYLEFNGLDDCRLYGPKGEAIQDVKPEGEVPVLSPQENEIVFNCEPSSLRPRANVTIMSEGETPLRRQ